MLLFRASNCTPQGSVPAFILHMPAYCCTESAILLPARPLDRLHPPACLPPTPPPRSAPLQPGRGPSTKSGSRSWSRTTSRIFCGDGFLKWNQMARNGLVCRQERAIWLRITFKTSPANKTTPKQPKILRCSKTAATKTSKTIWDVCPGMI